MVRFLMIRNLTEKQIRGAEVVARLFPKSVGLWNADAGYAKVSNYQYSRGNSLSCAKEKTGPSLHTY